MALVIVRADDYKKLLNALADLERYGGLEFVGKPREIPAPFADSVFKMISGKELVKRCKKAAIVRVSQSTSKAIGRIRDIHPPAHIVVVPESSHIHRTLAEILPKLPPIRGYTSPKRKIVEKRED